MSARASMALGLNIPSATARLSGAAFAGAGSFGVMTGFVMSFMCVLWFAVLVCALAFQLAQVGACLLCALVDMRGHRAPLQRIAQLGTQKAVGRVASGAGVISIGQIAHHCRVLVDDVRQYCEVVVVDDDVNLAP